MAKLNVQDLDVTGKRVLVRVDFNVPLQDGLITDDTRIQAALPTIEELSHKGAKVILMSHLGRPKGQPNPEFSLRPAAERLSELLGKPVAFAKDTIGESAQSTVEALENGQVALLENVRFHSEETENEEGFAQALARLGEVYVNDAFGTAHRAHASTAGVCASIELCAAGYLLQKELQYLQGELEEPDRPFLVILGGAKVSDKIEVIKALLDKANAIIIGGAMANTFRHAQGYQMGKSLKEDDKADLAIELLKSAESKGVQMLLPIDTRITQEFKEGAETKVTEPFGQGGEVPADWEGIDIGDKAIENFRAVIQGAGTIVWNGPMGVFEIEAFSKGTREVARAIAESRAITIVGGGDSVTAVKKFGYAEQMTFISTGGGASLELLEGKTLPGVAALTDA
ncbi:MAG: phosphoglycerate kinase [Verrucomicrobiota bacterium]